MLAGRRAVLEKAPEAVRIALGVAEPFFPTVRYGCELRIEANAQSADERRKRIVEVAILSAISEAMLREVHEAPESFAPRIQVEQLRALVRAQKVGQSRVATLVEVGL